MAESKSVTSIALLSWAVVAHSMSLFFSPTAWLRRSTSLTFSGASLPLPTRTLFTKDPFVLVSLTNQVPCTW